MLKPISGTLPSGKTFSVDLRLNHPSLLPGVQNLSEKTLLSSGKRLRPRLCFLMAEAAGVEFEKVSPYARIVELVHAATLAHDDVIDEATKRRGKATLNEQLTQARAVLSGDLLLSRAMVELAELGNLALLKRMAEVLEDLVTGEWLQLECRGEMDTSLIALEKIAQLKTASVLEWCAQVPFYLLNSSDSRLLSAQNFGKHLGIAFQMVDDCLDFSPNSGKAFAKDLQEEQVNFVVRKFLDQAPEPPKNFDSLRNLLRPDTPGLQGALLEIRTLSRFHLELASKYLKDLQGPDLKPQSFAHLHALLQDLAEREI